jgi:phospholipase/carboxylesterase
VPSSDRLISPSRSPRDASKLLVLLHGLGSNEEDLFALAPDLGPNLTIVSLRAPHDYAYGGYAWFDVVWDENGISFDSEQALQSVKELSTRVKDIQVELGYERRQTILGGFSQGAMMAIGLMFLEPSICAEAVMLSGCIVPSFVQPGVRLDARIFMSHGKLDQVLPVELGRQAANVLREHGAKVEYHEYPIAHEVSLPCLRDIQAWFAESSA